MNATKPAPTQFLDTLESVLTAAGLRPVAPVTRGRGREARVELPSGDLLGCYCRADIARAVLSDDDDVLGGGGAFVAYRSSERLVVWLGDGRTTEASHAGASVNGRLIVDASEAACEILALVQEGERRRAEWDERRAAPSLIRVYHEPNGVLYATWQIDGRQTGLRGAALTPPEDLPERVAECWREAASTGKYVEAPR